LRLKPNSYRPLLCVSVTRVQVSFLLQQVCETVVWVSAFMYRVAQIKIPEQ